MQEQTDAVANGDYRDELETMSQFQKHFVAWESVFELRQVIICLISCCLRVKQYIPHSTKVGPYKYIQGVP
jgi:hypothetical protein